MCIGPLLGSVITEPAAITISASLLMSKFFEFSPSGRLKYATVGLLFMAVSTGGTLTHFAAPPVLMVARTWGWDTAYMMSTFGAKAVVGIFVSTAAYYVLFRREFAELEARRRADTSLHVAEMPSPMWLRAFHIGFLAAAVLSMHYPVLLIFILMTFIAFCDVTSAYSQKLRYKSPILVAIFLSALVAHGSLQGWWIEPLLTGLGNRELFLGGMALSAFNDNAAITYLASLVPGFTESMKYMLVAGRGCRRRTDRDSQRPQPRGVLGDEAALQRRHIAEIPAMRNRASDGDNGLDILFRGVKLSTELTHFNKNGRGSARKSKTI